MALTWHVLRRAWRDAGGAAIADDAFDQAPEIDDPMASLLSPEKGDLGPKRRHRAVKQNGAKGAAIDKYAAVGPTVEAPAHSRLMRPSNSDNRKVKLASFKRKMSRIAVDDLLWLIQSIGDDIRACGVPDIVGGDRDEAAVAAADMCTDSPPGEAAQGSGAGFTVAWGFKGSWVATIARDCPDKGKTIEMDVKRLSLKKWTDVQLVKGSSYAWSEITREQKRQAALDYLELAMAKFAQFMTAVAGWGFHGAGRSCGVGMQLR